MHVRHFFLEFLQFFFPLAEGAGSLTKSRKFWLDCRLALLLTISQSVKQAPGSEYCTMPAATATVNAASSAKRKASTSKAPSTAAAGSRSASVSSTTSAGKSKSKGKAVAPTKAGSDQVDAGGALIDGHVSQSQVEKAVKALQAHRKRAQAEDEKHQLPLSGHDDVEGEGARADPADVLWLMVTTKTINENAPPKPVRM